MTCPKNCDCRCAHRFILADVRDVYTFAFVLIRPCPDDARKLASFPPGLKEAFLRACGYAPRSPSNADAWKLRVCRARRRSALGRERWSGVPRRRASDRTWFAILRRRIPRGRPMMSRRLAKLVIAAARRCGFPIPRSESPRKASSPSRQLRAISRIAAKRVRFILRRRHFDEGGTRTTWKRALWAAKRAAAAPRTAFARALALRGEPVLQIQSINLHLSMQAMDRRHARREALARRART